MQWRVLITCPQLQSSVHHYLDLFAAHGIEVELPYVTQRLNEAELLNMIDRVDGVIAGDDEFTARVLEKARRLKVIAKWGVGIDAIDLTAANRLGIHVSNTPNAFTDEVADVVMGYIVLLARQLHKLDQSVRDGGWKKIQGVSLRGKTLGVMGAGNIGRAVVRRAAVAGMSVVGYDVAPVPPSIIDETGLRPMDLDGLLQASDFISLNCNLTPSNHHMLGAREFALMKDGVYIINTARGPLIDEAALVQALREGKVAGAALDVFEDEPLPGDSPLHQFDNCVFGTHNSSNTLEAVMRVNELAIRNLLEGLGGSAEELKIN
jgi:D-3-phosphoglycerate dehydrogenase